MDKSNLNEGPVGRKLVQISGPMTLGIFSVLAVGLADAFFLARAGDSELTAIGFVYPVIVAISAFSVGLSAGANTALSQARGRGDGKEGVSRLALHAAMIGLGVGLLYGAVLWAGAPWLFGLLGAKDAVLENVLAYIPYWAASFPILVVTMIVNSAFRAAGDGLTAAAMMVLTAVLNIALTPALIFGSGPLPEMGMAGAGLATLVARSVAVVLVLMIAFRRGVVLLDLSPWNGFARSFREIMQVALPAAFSRGINPAGMAAVTAAVAVVGDPAVAGFGAASRVQAIALVPFFALASGLGPVVGQAWGASDTDRARHAMRNAAVFILAYGGFLAGVLTLLADPIARVMTADGTSAGYAADYLRFVGWTLGGYGMAVAANAAMTGRSRAGWAMGLSLTRILVVYIPMAWAGVILFGYPGVLAAAALANVFAFWSALVASAANGVGPTEAGPIVVPARWLTRAMGRGTRPEPSR